MRPLAEDRLLRTAARRGAPICAIVVVVAIGLAACSDDKATKVVAGSQPEEPAAGSWKTWVLSSPTDVAVPAPPQAGSAVYDADLARVNIEAASRTSDAEATVRKWSDPVPTQPWTDLAFNLISKTPENPPLAARNLALVAAAMYDATVAAWHYKYVYNSPAPPGVKTVVPAGSDPSYPSEHAAIAGAASRVLAYLYAGSPQPVLEQLAQQAADSRVTAGTNTPSDVNAGLALGRGVADKVIARAQSDGADRAWDGSRPAGVGGGPQFWEPSPENEPPAPAAAPQPVAPMAGTWKPWVLSAANQFDVPPPLQYGTSEFTAAAQDVVDTKSNLTADQRRIADLWGGGAGTKSPAGLSLEAGLGDIRDAATSGNSDARLSVPRAVRAVALVAVALADSSIASAVDKYAYWAPRPENAIRDLKIDGGWTPYLPTPNSPAYPSDSATFAGAAQVVLTYLFPNKAASFLARAQEQSTAGLYAGTDWRFDSDSLDMGRQIGLLVVDRAKTDGASK